jgi:phosphoglycerate kinase
MSLNKKTIRDLKPAGRRIFVRVDFNVPLEGGRVADDRRVRESIPTLRHLAEAGGRVIVASHLGRPKGRVKPESSLRPVAELLPGLLGRSATFVPVCGGAQALDASRALADGEVLLLENLRFDPGEEANDPVFAGELASLAECYVNDAFGTAHRAHASTVGVARLLKPAVAGLLMEREINTLSRLLDRADRPYVAVLGGAKISGKIELIRNLLGRVDRLLIGGAMAYTLLRATGAPTGRSLVEEDLIDLAGSLLELARRKGVSLLLPEDHVVAPSLDAGERRVTPDAAIPAGMVGGDIGPRTAQRYAMATSDAATILWNGPMGAFEKEGFGEGTRVVGEAIAACRGFTVVGGGDSAAAAERYGLAHRFGHVSTGGGATLEFLSGLTLPGVEILEDAVV